VDHPATLAWARERFRERGLATPSNLSFVTADLEKHELAQRLGEHGFSEQVCTFCSVLGVIYYLSWGAIEALFRFAVSLPSQSEVVFSFTPPDEALEGHDLTVALYGSGLAASVGEPWKTRMTASEISNLLANLGYGEVLHLTPNLAQERYFAGRTDSLRAPHIEQLIAAIV
jgi:O-methyltransferase involved in polyketide biosynthesis